MNLTKKSNYPWILVTIYSLLGFCLPSTVTQFTMLIGTIAKKMQVSEQTVLLADTFRAVCLVTALFISSFLYKKFGLRKTILIGLCCQIIPQFILPIGIEHKNLFVLYIFKGMQGVNAIAFPLYISTITSWVDEKSKGFATSVFNGGFTAGAGLGAWVSGKVIPIFGWKISFYFLGIICIIIAIPVLLITREKETENSFKKQSRNSSHYNKIFKQKLTWMLVFSLLANTWITQAITVDMPIYSSYLGYSYNQIGTLMLIISIISIIFSIIGGIISDLYATKSINKVSSRVKVLSYGYAVAAVTCIILPFIANKGFLFTILIVSIIMLGVSWAQGVYWAIPSELYKVEDNVIITSICSGASNLVNPIAPMVVGVILGTRGLWKMAWITCAIIAILSMISALVIPKIKTNDVKN
ncbi:MFS transporter [Fusobacterium simiae]|uniref:MFS transporter n=1 Tax=Fusobacterium simiae TaxID=855 RepID=A0ABT4DJ48_FUSSI|nr:MFS transporter [Fusobacterium simiae]MCY7008639.1 MFS transporter [Fusobacterium simiae]